MTFSGILPTVRQPPGNHPSDPHTDLSLLTKVHFTHSSTAERNPDQSTHILTYLCWPKFTSLIHQQLRETQTSQPTYWPISADQSSLHSFINSWEKPRPVNPHTDLSLLTKVHFIPIQLVSMHSGEPLCASSISQKFPQWPNSKATVDRSLLCQPLAPPPVFAGPLVHSWNHKMLAVNTPACYMWLATCVMDISLWSGPPLFKADTVTLHSTLTLSSGLDTHTFYLGAAHTHTLSHTHTHARTHARTQTHTHTHTIWGYILTSHSLQS